MTEALDAAEARLTRVRDEASASVRVADLTTLFAELAYLRDKVKRLENLFHESGR